MPGTENLPGSDGGLTETASAILYNTQPEVFAQLGIAFEYVERGLSEAAAAFADTFWVSWILVVLT